MYNKSWLKRPLTNTQNQGVNENGILMCRMLSLEHSAILLTCIKQYSVLKTNFIVLLKWPLMTDFTV